MWGTVAEDGWATEEQQGKRGAEREAHSAWLPSGWAPEAPGPQPAWVPAGTCCGEGRGRVGLTAVFASQACPHTLSLIREGNQESHPWVLY